MAMVVVMMAGCDSGTSTQGEPESHENESNQLTLFTDEVELFIEFDPLVAGEPSNFLVHVTLLESYRPCKAGRVTLETGAAVATSSEPSSPGIFSLALVPEKEGEFDLVCTLETAGDTATVRYPVDIHGAGEESHEEAHEEDEVTHESHEDAIVGEVTFTKRQAWRSDFMVRAMSNEPFSAVLTASGEIVTLPGEKKNLASPGSGMILFPNADLVQGTRVNAGQLLFMITAGTLEGDNFELRYQEYRNRLNSSRTEYKRRLQLYEQNVIPERQYLESRTDYISDSIRYYSLAGKAGSGGLQVYAPAGGYVHHLNVSEGQYVETGELLATLSSDQKLLLRADVPQQHFQLLKQIVSARFRPAFTDRIYTIEELNGTLLARGSSVAENDHYIPLYFKLENDGTLLEGAYAECYLIAQPRQESMVVPQTAILEEQGYYYLYVQVTGESYTKRAVRIGASDGLRTEIISGLEQGERVVTRGAMLLKSASMVTVEADHGHSH